MSKTHKINYNYVLFVTLFYFFLLKDLLEHIFTFLTYTDELLAAMAIPIFIVRTKERFNKRQRIGYGPFIALFLLCSFLGSIIYRYQPFVKVVLPDMFLCAKFWLAIYVGRFAFKKMSFRHYSAKIFKHVKFVSWTYFILIICNYIGLIPFEYAEIRYGLPAIKLFYFHPTVMVFNSVFLLAVLISIKSYVHGTNKYFFLICLIACTSLRGKAFGAVILFVFIYYVVFVYRKKINLYYIVLLVPLIMLAAWNQVYYYFLSTTTQDGSARYQLFAQSFNVANDHFPTGAGFGTFASHLSGKYYSPLYYKYGLSEIWGITEDRWDFVSDTFWPMIIGQAGWLGLLFFVIAIINLFLQIQRLEKRSLALYSSGLVILFYILIDSTGSAAFVTPLSIPLAFWLGVVLSEGEKRQKLHDDRIASEEAEKKEKKKRRKRDKRAFVPEPVAKAPNPQVIETPNQNVVESFVSNEPIKPKRVAQIKDIRFSKKVVKRKAEKFDVKNDFKLSSKQEK